MRLAHILLVQKYEAEDVLRLFRSGKSFHELAGKFSQCSSSKNGGDLGDIPASRLDEEFLEAAQKLKLGEISPIVKTRFGYHLIQRLK